MTLQFQNMSFSLGTYETQSELRRKAENGWFLGGERPKEEYTEKLTLAG